MKVAYFFSTYIFYTFNSHICCRQFPYVCIYNQVPTFKDGDLVVNESNAICMYIEEKYSNVSNRLLPNTPEERSKVFWKIFETGNVEIKALDGLAYYFYYTPKDERSDKVLQEKMAVAKSELAYWEKVYILFIYQFIFILCLIWLAAFMLYIKH